MEQATVIADTPPKDAQKEKIDTRKPSMYAVVLYNDNTTSPTFVIRVLEEAFNMDHQNAVLRMSDAHYKGSSVVKVTTKDLAETQLSIAGILIGLAEPDKDFYRNADTCELKFSLQPA